MKTIILDEPGAFRIADTERPAAPAPGEALVRVKRVGICGTDLHAYRGRQPFFSYPRILGHELGVEVIAVGDGPSHISVGDRCSVEPYLNCGHCIACRRGKTNCCVSLQVLGVHTDGGMREEIIVPVAKLHPSDILDYEQLALVETLGIGAHAVDRAQLEQGEFALVIGAGPIGLSVAQFAVPAGARVIVMDINAARMEFCRQQIGTEFTVEAGENALKQIEDITGGDMPTAVFDATGSAQSMMGAFQYVASGGRLTFVGLVQADISFTDPLLHRREMTILASRNSTGKDFKRIIELMETGAIDTRPWITHRAECSNLPGLFPGYLEPDAGVIKAVVEF